MTVNENLICIDYASGIRLPDCFELAINWKNENYVIIFWHYVIVRLFWRILFLLSSLVTGSNFMSMSSLHLEIWQFSFIRDWPEIRKWEIPISVIWVFPHILRLGQVTDTKFGTKVSNKMLLNAAKCQEYSFYRFLVIKGKPTGEEGKITPPFHQD